MSARRTSARLWLCQIITCLHGDKTWNSAAWFACVSSRMHNASRAWIIYINKWRESVWCSAKPFLFYFHLKGFFLCVCVCVCLCVEKKKKKENLNKPPYWRDRWQTGWNWVSYPKSHCDGNGGCHGNQEVEQFVGLSWEDTAVTWQTQRKIIHICKYLVNEVLRRESEAVKTLVTLLVSLFTFHLGHLWIINEGNELVISWEHQVQTTVFTLK